MIYSVYFLFSMFSSNFSNMEGRLFCIYDIRTLLYAIPFASRKPMMNLLFLVVIVCYLT